MDELHIFDSFFGDVLKTISENFGKFVLGVFEIHMDGVKFGASDLLNCCDAACHGTDRCLHLEYDWVLIGIGRC